MRFMVFVKATPDSEAGIMPEPGLLSAMMNFNEELAKAGVLESGEGLKPSSCGARVRFSKGKTQVVDGPFAETKELVAGYWIWNCASLDEAIEWVKRCPAPMGDGKDAEIEIRPFYSIEDFGDAVTPEVREQESRLRAALETK